MLTLQSNNEIRINKGDSGMSPLFINIGDSLQPIGYEFNVPIEITSEPELDIIFYEDIWRDKVIVGGDYTFIFNDGQWSLSGEEVDIKDYGIEIKNKSYSDNQTITVNFSLIDNDSKVYFQM